MSGMKSTLLLLCALLVYLAVSRSKGTLLGVDKLIHTLQTIFGTSFMSLVYSYAFRCLCTAG